MTINTPDPGPIGQVRTGMHVVDADGDEIGTVKEVVMSDPGVSEGAAPPETPSVAVIGIPVGTAGSAGAAGTALGVGAVGTGLPDVERSRLLRTGYVRVDLKGLFSGHRFAAGDEIGEVVDDVVRLTVPSARLVG